MLLVDYTSRLFREGKAVISREVAAIFERLGSSAETGQSRLEKLTKGRLFGRFFAASRARLRQLAERLGLRRVPNLGGCPATYLKHEAPIASRCRDRTRDSLRAFGGTKVWRLPYLREIREFRPCSAVSSDWFVPRVVWNRPKRSRASHPSTPHSDLHVLGSQDHRYGEDVERETVPVLDGFVRIDRPGNGDPDRSRPHRVDRHAGNLAGQIVLRA
ncbi:MAG: hypothetical protein ACLQIB_32930 [Isosphaeraceae bacterium]